MKLQNTKLNTKLLTRDCDFIASWPGIGNVSLIIARYMQEKLNAQEIGHIEPFDFFDPIGVMVKNNVIEAPQFPENKFYFFRNPKAQRDLVLFISDEQPRAKGYDLANHILDICSQIKVKRVFTCAAAIVRIHHTETPKVWAAATNPKLIEEIKKYNVILKGQIQIAGLNGLFLGVAKERDVDGICLLGETPSYTTRIPNPKAAAAILEVLIKMLNVELDLTELKAIAKQSEETMKKIAAEAMEEYITSYTKPVWPPEAAEEFEEEEIDEEEDEEDEEDEENESDEDKN
jgi:proteasome assembly chaperone (PAC2) family protein